MAWIGALTMTLALSAGVDADRLLLCRPKLLGDAALARAEAVSEGARAIPGRFLDYGVACDDAAEAARAARRAGMAYGVASTAEGRTEGSRFVIALARADSDRSVAGQTVDVGPGADAAGPIRDALAELVRAIPRDPPPARARVAAWTVAGTGAALATQVPRTHAAPAAQSASCVQGRGAGSSTPAQARASVSEVVTAARPPVERRRFMLGSEEGQTPLVTVSRIGATPSSDARPVPRWIRAPPRGAASRTVRGADGVPCRGRRSVGGGGVARRRDAHLAARCARMPLALTARVC